MNFFDELLSEQKDDKTYPEITAPGLLNAIVKDIWDEQHKGMIKVEYLMGEKNKKTSDWVRVMTSYGGDGFGNYWLPEIGSEVLVGFIHGNMNMPVVLGCLWNGKDKFPEGAVDKKNETKTIMTKGGNKITFTETEGKEKITVTTPKKLEILLDDEKEAVLVQDKEKENSIHIDCKNGTMKLKAKKEISLSIGTKEVMSASSDTVKLACGTIQLDAQQTLKLTGQSASVKGTSVKVKADGELGLQASGMAQLKGSMVKIN
ncbi:MAG: hypothetical protein HDR25_00925 [Lachnospiraceae bacterium]|nr:hypothetical protein [Lachnospiraceae bacterium]